MLGENESNIKVKLKHAISQNVWHIHTFYFLAHTFSFYTLTYLHHFWWRHSSGHGASKFDGREKSVDFPSFGIVRQSPYVEFHHLGFRERLWLEPLLVLRRCVGGDHGGATLLLTGGARSQHIGEREVWRLRGHTAIYHLLLRPGLGDHSSIHTDIAFPSRVDDWGQFESPC